MKLLRQIHLYLGCLFSPVLIFFITSGCLQTFRFNDRKKDGSYTPPAWIEKMSDFHTHQIYRTGNGHFPDLFSLFVLAMAVSFLVTVILGVVLAFQVSKKKSWVVWLCLVAGIVLPALLMRLS